MPAFTNRSGDKLWYEESGTGYPVVLVHGWGMSSIVWKPVMQRLEGCLRTIAIDLRGHGRSSGIFSDYTLESFSNDLEDLCIHLCIRGCVLVGWSMGSQVVINLALHAKHICDGVVTLCGTPCFSRREGYEAGLSKTETDGMALKIRRSPGRAVEGFRGLMFPEAERDFASREVMPMLCEIKVPDGKVLLDSLAVLVDTDLRPVLKNLDRNALVIGADDDVICPIEASEIMAAAFNNAHLLVLKGSGHAPLLVRPEDVARHLHDFTRRFNG